jgi:hypothetical protein
MEYAQFYETCVNASADMSVIEWMIAPPPLHTPIIPSFTSLLADITHCTTCDCVDDSCANVCLNVRVKRMDGCL